MRTMLLFQRGGGGYIKNNMLALEVLTNIDRRLTTLCTLIEDLSISLGVKVE